MNKSGLISEVAKRTGQTTADTLATVDAVLDVIVDEASQAFLTMLAAANMLGKKNLWVGDVCQMPPIVKTSKDRIRKQTTNNRR